MGYHSRLDDGEWCLYFYDICFFSWSAFRRGPKREGLRGPLSWISPPRRGYRPCTPALGTGLLFRVLFPRFTGSYDYLRGAAPFDWTAPLPAETCELNAAPNLSSVTTCAIQSICDSKDILRLSTSETSAFRVRADSKNNGWPTQNSPRPYTRRREATAMAGFARPKPPSDIASAQKFLTSLYSAASSDGDGLFYADVVLGVASPAQKFPTTLYSAARSDGDGWFCADFERTTNFTRG